MKSKLLPTAILALLLASSAYGQNINVGRYDGVHIVPAPGKMTIDGDLGDWDRSGEFFTYRFEEQKDRYSVHGGMMYDADNLYIAAHIGDRSPMMNQYNPAAEATEAWRGDCLQVRVCFDRAIGWPVRDGTTKSDQLAHLTLWFYTPQSQPCLMIQYGMDFHGQSINPPGFQGAYRQDADGKGFVLEYAIPWKLLHVAGQPPKGGEVFACTWQQLWSDEQGRTYRADLSEIRNPNDPSLAYQSASAWGKAIFEKAGKLPPGTVVAREEKRLTGESAGFIPLAYTVPGKQSVRIGMQLCDAQGHTVRWLLGDAPRPPGKNTESWNGLDNDGNPVPPGKYTVKWCSSDVHGKLLASANNAGNPPYNTSDNRGSWAGDYGWPTAVAANDTHLFLAHLGGEASRILIKCTPDGQRVWGIDTTLDLGPHVIDMATDGTSLYVLKGDFKGGPAVGGIAKISCATGFNEPIGQTGRSSIVLTNYPLTGIAANTNALFVSSESAGRIYCFDKQTAQPLRVIENVKQPRGLMWGTNGWLYAVAGDEVLRMKPDGSERGVLVQQLAEPRRITVAKNGEFFVTLQGVYHQVLHYDPSGKLLNAIGQRGGMLVPGPWVKEAMLRPLGVALAPDGNLWVTEERMNPKRSSVWQPAGAFVREFIGPVPYASTCVMDGARPEFIYSENTEFKIDYATGQTQPSAVVYDDGDRGQVGPLYGFWEGRFIHFKGRTFLMREQGNLWEWREGRFVPRVRFELVKPMMTGNPYWPQHMMMGLDRNENGKFEPAEMQDCPVEGGASWMGWVADNLDIYCGDWNSIWRLPFEGFDARGLPIYQMEHRQLLLTKQPERIVNEHGGKLFPVPGTPDCWMVDADGNLYVVMTTGQDRIVRGLGYLDKGHRLVKFSPDLRVLWEYRNFVVGMGASWNTTMSKPGEILGSMKFTGEFGRYLTIGSYFGQYHVLDKETGLYITALTPDTRGEPTMDGMAVFTENFNGCAVYVPQWKKYLYCGGDANARVWEVQGLDAVKFANFSITVSPPQHAQAVAANKAQYGVAATGPAQKLAMVRSLAVTVDGDLAEWQGVDWQSFEYDANRHARAAATWMGNTLAVAFDVTDDSPMRNRGGDQNLLFKTGDAVEFCLSSAPADAERKDEQPIGGDQRILITFVNDKPIALLYEPKSKRANKTPATFSSPVGTVIYEHVATVPAQVAIKRTATGYTLEAQFDITQLGFIKFEVGQQLRGDFGVLFSDKGGALTLTRTMWSDNHPEVSVNNDIPTESRIHPKHWGRLAIR